MLHKQVIQFSISHFILLFAVEGVLPIRGFDDDRHDDIPGDGAALPLRRRQEQRARPRRRGDHAAGETSE